jgi:hypothetical protein
LRDAETQSGTAKMELFGHDGEGVELAEVKFRTVHLYV